jgi:hypothetical protein
VLQDSKGAAPGAPSDVFWLFDTPDAMRRMLSWVSKRYSRPELWVTENGAPAPEEASKALGEALKDTYRLDFFKWARMTRARWAGQPAAPCLRLSGGSVAVKGSAGLTPWGAPRHGAVARVAVCGPQPSARVCPLSLPPPRGYLASLCRAVSDDSVNLSAYFAWSLLDNLEWNEGFRPRFGLVHVDRASRELRRYPKLSAYWLSHHFFKVAPERIACLGGWLGWVGADAWMGWVGTDAWLGWAEARGSRLRGGLGRGAARGLGRRGAGLG